VGRVDHVAVAFDVAVAAADDEEHGLLVERVRHLAWRRGRDVEQSALAELAGLALHLDLHASAVDEVQLVLRVVVVVEAFEMGRVHDPVHAECRHAERASYLAEAGAVAELVEGRERVRHSLLQAPASARGSLPRRSASCLCSSSLNWEPKSSSRSARCVARACSNFSSPASVSAAYVTRASEAQCSFFTQPARSRPSRRRVIPEGLRMTVRAMSICRMRRPGAK